MVTIRLAVPEDAEGIARVLVDCWKWAYSGIFTPEFMEARCDYAARTQKIRDNWQAHGRNWVAVDSSGAVIGTASEQVPPQLANADCEIGSLYVHPSAARAGVGRDLVRTLAHEFAAADHRVLAIHTLARNTIGCAFYEKLGGLLEVRDDWNGHVGVWFVWRDLRVLTADR